MSNIRHTKSFHDLHNYNVVGPANDLAVMEFEFSFPLLDNDVLCTHIHDNKLLVYDDMWEHYPEDCDYLTVKNWCISKGLTIVKEYNEHNLSLFVSAPVHLIRTVFGVGVNEVEISGSKYLTITDAPFIPQEISNIIIGINGLQQNICATKHARATNLQTTGTFGPYWPIDIVSSYTPKLSTSYGGIFGNGVNILTNKPECIAIIIDAIPLQSDMLSYAQWDGALSLGSLDMTFINTSTLSGADRTEATLDAQWAISVSPAASLRLYGAGDLQWSNLNKALAQCLIDASIFPIHQLSMSFSISEHLISAYPSVYESFDQYLAAFAAMGISIFASSGDTGSRHYGVQSAGYPATNPNVCAVGGTTLLARISGITSEVVWNNGPTGTTYSTPSGIYSEILAGGGGQSILYSKPAYQAALPGDARQIPDLACTADPHHGGYIICDDSWYTLGGTSWSAPIMAAMSAKVNFARRLAGYGPIGNWNNYIYSISSTFFDVTSGDNGDYTAGIGYDNCTGLGVIRDDTLVALSGCNLTSIVPPTSALNITPATIAYKSVGLWSKTLSDAEISSHYNNGLGITFSQL